MFRPSSKQASKQYSVVQRTIQDGGGGEKSAHPY